MRILHLVISLLLFLFTLNFHPMEIIAGTHMRYNYEYVGIEMCKLCHNKKELGGQYDIWTNSAHSRAFYALGTSEARKIADKIGINDPQQNGKCLRCHSTSYAFSEEKAANDLKDEDGVQCESCHGPGEEYSYKKVMENREQAKVNGLIMPTEDTCRKCHNPECPAWDEERDITPDGKRVGFYFPLRWEMTGHHKIQQSGANNSEMAKQENK